MLSFGSVSGDGPRRLHLAVNEPQSCLFIYILFLLGGGRVVKSFIFAGLARAEAERAGVVEAADDDLLQRVPLVVRRDGQGPLPSAQGSANDAAFMYAGGSRRGTTTAWRRRHTSMGAAESTRSEARSHGSSA